jgi:hypothetical protein
MSKCVQEVSPPGPKAEKWIVANKPRFQKQYGDKWEEILYSTAWKLFGEELTDEEECMASDKINSTSMNEASVALPHQVASSEPDSAVTMRDLETVKPKHIDVVFESDLRPYSSNGNMEEGYRFLIQYSTAQRPEFFPALDIQSAPTIDALVAMYPDQSCPAMIDAVMRAVDEPHKRPQFSGNK